MSLNREHIINEIQSLIKALKDCGGWVKRGNGEGWFNHEILADALALIKELTEKIGDLECKVEEYRADAISWQATVDEISNGDKALYDAINSLRRKSREYDELNLKAYNLNMEIKELTEENERLRAKNEKARLWTDLLKSEAQELPIKTERIRVADAITDEIYMRYRQGECFDYGGTWNCDKFKALLEDIRGKYIPEEKWEDRDC